MQPHDLARNPSLDPSASDPSTMSEHSSPIHSPKHHSSGNPENQNTHDENNTRIENIKEDNVKSSSSNHNGNNNLVARRERPSRACTQRAAARMQAAAEAESVMAEAERKRKKTKRMERLAARLLKEESEEEAETKDEDEEEEAGEEEDGEENGSLSSAVQQCSKTVTPLVGEPEPSQLPRWSIRTMWQLASILNFLNVFRHLLNIKVEFSAEEFETALIMPNNTLGDIHMPLLKAIPPVTRMALGHGTWITVLCRKLKNWWHWVAEGDIPIVASHGAEIEAYNSLDPGLRVVILKALCDIRVEQEDIRNYIDDSIKHGVQLSVFRKERLGGDSHGTSYWYEDDSVIGQRLYREIRKVEVKKGKGKNIPPIPHSCYQWEAVATNLDEFQNVAEKLFLSKNRTEVSVGKKLKKDMLPEIEKVHKKKERLLKKQHRQALMLDNMINMDGLAAGRSLRDRKPVTYTFDDYDRSINEAIKVTKKKHPSPEPFDRRDPHVKHEVSTNGGCDGPSQYSRHASFSSHSPKSTDDEYYDDHKAETLDYSNRRRQRPERLKEFVETVSGDETVSDSDGDIVGEVVYDEEYLRKRKQRRKMSSSSEGDEEYLWDEENPEEEEEEEDDTLSTSEESDEHDEPHKYKKLPSRTRRGTKLRSVDELQSGLRRSKRATRTRIDYKQYEMSESDTESMKPEKLNSLDESSTASDNSKFSMESRDSAWNNNNKHEMQVNQPTAEHPEMINEEQTHPPEKSDNTGQDQVGVKKRHFLDLNELAPGSGFDDVPNSMKDEDTDDFLSPFH